MKLLKKILKFIFKPYQYNTDDLDFDENDYFDDLDFDENDYFDDYSYRG